MSVLVCENCSKILQKKEIIKNFSYNFLENQVYAILGKSNSGQNELLNLITGRIMLTEGQIFLDGLPFGNHHRHINKICFIASDMRFSGQTNILQIFKMMASFYPNWDSYYAYELLLHYNIKHHTAFKQLTINQKTILIGILGLASRANITVFDNPMESVDLKDRYDFFNFLYQHQGKYPRTFILSTNLIDEIDYLVDKILLMDHGKLIAHFTIEEIKENFRYLTGKTEVLKSLISGVKIIGVEERGKTLTVCIREKLKKDEIRKYQKYLIKISEVPIQKIFIYLIHLREKKGIS